jgi:2-methylcitrate dehydratase PrpD
MNLPDEMMVNLERSITEHIVACQFEDLSAAAVSSARRSALDTIGAMLAGSSAPGIDTVVELASGWGGAQESSLMGYGIKLPAPAAAWCNGTMARALEIDDCVDFLPVHPSASAVPALLALAELRGGLSGREFITSLAVGQDLIIRLGLAVRQNAMQSGRNNLFKIFGPTAAIARALKLNSNQVQNALGISFSHAIGDAQCALDGALALRLQQGIVAQGALISGLLAEKGFTGAQEFLLGRWGYLSVWEPDPRLEYLTNGLGREFYGERITIKPFSSCRATHPSIDLALSLSKSNNIFPESIQMITVRTTPEIHNLVASPPASKIRPDSVATAQFSIQYTVSAALLRGDMFLAELDPKLFQDPKIVDLAGRVQVEAEPQLRTDSVLGRTILEITTRDGKKFGDEIKHPLGSPERPLNFEDCSEKLRKCARFAVHPPDETVLEKVIRHIAHLEKLDDVAVIMHELCSGRKRVSRGRG